MASRVQEKACHSSICHVRANIEKWHQVLYKSETIYINSYALSVP